MKKRILLVTLIGILLILPLWALAEGGESRDVVYETVNELTVGKDIAEIHSFRMEETEDGKIRFTLEYTMPERMYMTVFNPPDGDLFQMFSNTVTVPGKSTFTFELSAEDVRKAVITAVMFYSEDNGRYFVTVSAIDNNFATAEDYSTAEEVPLTTEGNPVGDPKDVVFSTSNELSEGKDIAEIHSFRMQELDNGSLRFTVEYTMPERLYISIFDSPNGDNIQLVSNAITTPGKSVFNFDLSADAFSKSEMVVLNFYSEDSNRYFVFFKPADNLAAAETVPAEEEPAAEKENRAEGNPVGDPQDLIFGTSNELSEGKDIAEIHSFRMQKLDNGFLRFTIEYTMPERLQIAIFNPPNGDLFHLVSNAITMPGKSTFSFDLNEEDYYKAETVVMNFFSGDDNQFFVTLNPADNLPLEGNPVGDPKDVVFSTSNELSEGKDIAEIHSFRMQKLDNGSIRFTVEYTMPERLYISIFDSPNGDNIQLVSNAITTPGKSVFNFDLSADAFSKSEMVVLNFYSEDSNRYFVFFSPTDNLPAAGGNPVGDPRDVVYQTNNELSEGKDIAEIHSFCMQELDNGFLRFTVEYTMPERLYISVFDSPNGDNINLVSNAITVPGKSTFNFDLDAAAFSRSETVVLIFYSEDSNRYFVFFSPTDNLPG